MALKNACPWRTPLCIFVCTQARRKCRLCIAIAIAIAIGLAMQLQLRFASNPWQAWKLWFP